MSGGVLSKGSVLFDYEFSMYYFYCIILRWIEKVMIIKV